MAERTRSFPPEGRFRIRIRGPRDFYGGLVLIAIAMLAFWASSDLAGQRGFIFGPGTAPRLFAGLLTAVGGLVTLTGLLVDGPKLEKYAVKGPAFVVGGILTFAALIRGISLEPIGLPLSLPPMGLVLSTFLGFEISVLGSREFRWVEGLLAGFAMTAFCVVLFFYVLQLPFDLWPTP